MKAEGNIQVKESSTFGKAKWKQRFCKIEDEKMHIFADKADTKPKTTFDVMKVNDLCKSPSLDPQFVFEFTIGGKSHSFAADSAEMRTRFIAVLIQNGALNKEGMADKEIDVSGSGLTEWPKSTLYKLDATKINVSENQLSIVPEEIGCFDKLETLNVSFNQLKSIPESLKLVAGTLRELNVTKNALTALPDLSSCTNLQLLWIGQNKLTAAPNWLPSLVALQRLSLASNPWTALPDMKTLVNLRWLDISGCKLTVLPDSIQLLVNLQVLEAFSNTITELPSWISSLSKLTELRLQRNKITSIPDSVEKMASLSEFDISHNALKTLPKWVGESKIFIECHNNPYEQIPRDVVLAGSQSIRQYVREKLA
eukprot:TRINITY_DN7184_c0_g1_i1.p1 TRINITY_DN7184_c0_g1~~TRINITY_DN7184_c0_g1_i1.p1  ORF type:complete len:368 (-),score=78.06 TRINITY_DN7184_c0_g1_i1:29-1132(-)